MFSISNIHWKNVKNKEGRFLGCQHLMKWIGLLNSMRLLDGNISYKTFERCTLILMCWKCKKKDATFQKHATYQFFRKSESNPIKKWGTKWYENNAIKNNFHLFLFCSVLCDFSVYYFPYSVCGKYPITRNLEGIIVSHPLLHNYYNPQKTKKILHA